MFGILVGLLTEYATYVAAVARGRDAVPGGGCAAASPVAARRGGV